MKIQSLTGLADNPKASGLITVFFFVVLVPPDGF